MIYIDPPYNTGDDGFIYPDKFEFDDETLKDMFGMNDKEFERLKSIQGTATHSAWLTFMYPRLWLAKRLLKENGVILLSIDDNEQANLTLLLNEIFGEGNKLPPFTWQNKKGGGNDSTHVAEETEVVLVYAKNINLVPKLFESYNSEYVKRYKEEDAYGRFYWDTFKRKSGKQYYPIEAPDGTILQYDEQGNEISWLRSEGRFYQDLENGEVKFVKNRAGEWNVHFKQRIPNGKKPRSILSDKGTTASGSQEILNYFSKEVFSNPKPTTLIEYFIEVFTDDKAIILDFFAGSANDC
ncbi:site-specific DNA-methyltransferase [Bacillus pacificus]